jgi:hypothetical protein
METETSFRVNFTTLTQAFRDKSVVLVEAWHTPEKADAAFICGINLLPDGSRELVPFAQMLDGQPEPVVLPASPDFPSSPFGLN